jgi:hypothetical protein
MARASKKAFKPQILTANRLHGGEVVYWIDENTWADSIDQAKVFLAPDELNQAEAIALGQIAKQIILDPYPFPVELDESGKGQPTQMREIIRAKGPTIRLDLGKQAQIGA